MDFGGATLLLSFLSVVVVRGVDQHPHCIVFEQTLGHDACGWTRAGKQWTKKKQNTQATNDKQKYSDSQPHGKQ
jgi:hypothetical protein